jgi:hypothetical protein
VVREDLQRKEYNGMTPMSDQNYIWSISGFCFTIFFKTYIIINMRNHLACGTLERNILVESGEYSLF